MKVAYGTITNVKKRFVNNREQIAYTNACFTIKCGGERNKWHSCGIRGVVANAIWRQAEIDCADDCAKQV